MSTPPQKIDPVNGSCRYPLPGTSIHIDSIVEGFVSLILRSLAPCRGPYSIFDSALYRNWDAKWLFPFRGPLR